MCATKGRLHFLRFLQACSIDDKMLLFIQQQITRSMKMFKQELPKNANGFVINSKSIYAVLIFSKKECLQNIN